jgi:pilus assembly protein Flp/PilA
VLRGSREHTLPNLNRLHGWTTVNEGEASVKKLLGKLRGLTRRDDGASAVEYGLLVALIAVVIAGTVVILGNALQNRFHDACQSVANAAPDNTNGQNTNCGKPNGAP